MRCKHFIWLNRKYFKLYFIQCTYTTLKLTSITILLHVVSLIIHINFIRNFHSFLNQNITYNYLFRQQISKSDGDIISVYQYQSSSISWKITISPPSNVISQVYYYSRYLDKQNNEYYLLWSGGCIHDLADSWDPVSGSSLRPVPTAGPRGWWWWWWWWWCSDEVGSCGWWLCKPGNIRLAWGE